MRPFARCELAPALGSTWEEGSDMNKKAKGLRARSGWVNWGVAAIAIMAPEMAAAQASSTADASTAPEIIVTANRRAERAQDVPIAITAMTPQRLEQQGINKEQDLQASVPSLVVGANGQGSRDSQSFTIRGQGATFQASPGVVVYLNEVPLPAALTLSQQGGPGNFVDLENLQVLSGPQGTLFGRNTTGGAVLLVPKKPTNELGGWIKGEYGNYNRTYIEGAINLPVIEDKLMVRVVGAYHRRDGYTHDVIWNKDRDNENWYSGRIGILFRPTDGIENYTMIYGAHSDNNGAGLIHKGFNIDGLKAIVNPADGSPAPACYEGPTIPFLIASCDVYRANTARADALGPRATAFSVDEFQRTKTWGVTNTTNIELSDNVTLRNIASFQRMQLRYRYDGDATALQQHEVDPGVLPSGTVDVPGLGPTTYGNATLARELPRDDLKGWTEELQFQGKMLDNKLNWTVGGFHYDQRPAGPQGSNAILYCPAAFTGNAFVCGGSTQISGITTVSNALYAQATLDFGAFSPALDSLRLTGGYRHTWDHVYGTASQYNRSPLLPAGFVACGKDNSIVPESSALASCVFDGSEKSDSPSWLIGLDYRPVKPVLLYAKVSRSYKAGGFNPYAVFFGQGTDPDTRTFKPEHVISYEAGFKADFRLGNVPVRFNTSLYEIHYNDIQRATGDYNPTTGAGGARTLNADAKIRGIEIEGSIRPWPGVEIGGNFSHTDAHYTKYSFVTGTGGLGCNGIVPPGGTVDASCLRFQYTAPYIWSLHASVDQPLAGNAGTLSLFVNYSHTASQYTEAVNVPAVQPGATIDAFGTLNASLDWRGVMGSKFDVGVFGTNITNELYRTSNADVYQQGGLLYWVTLYGEPRMYGVRLKYHFGGE